MGYHRMSCHCLRMGKYAIARVGGYRFVCTPSQSSRKGRIKSRVHYSFDNTRDYFTELSVCFGNSSLDCCNDIGDCLSGCFADGSPVPVISIF